MHKGILSLSCLLFAGAVSGAGFDAGLIGGTGVTNAFKDQTYQNPNATIRFYSQSKDYVVGPAVQLNLPMGLAVEADALYRPMNVATSTSTGGLPAAISEGTNSTWEFPILAKYRFPIPVAKPFVGLGPSFRRVRDSGPRLSDRGLTVGAGIELHLLIVRISPQFRYTHWGSDAVIPTIQNAVSNSNQGEFLVGITF